MANERPTSDAEGRFLLAGEEQHRKEIEEIRSGGYEKFIGPVVSSLILVSPFLLKLDVHWSNFIFMLSLAVAIGFQQRWNQGRLDALIRYLEKRDVFRK